MGAPVLEEAEEAASEVAIEAAGRFAACFAFAEASFDVGDPRDGSG